VSDDKVIEALVQALVTDERDVRYHAAQAIANARATSALPKLSEHRHDQNAEVRERIIIIFGQIGGSEQVPAVIEATNDTEPQVQLAAVNALRQLRERGATISLVPRLKDPNPHVRAAVCRALGDMGDKTVCPDVLPLLRDESGYVRSAAAEALGKLGDRSSIVPLITVLSGERPAEGKQSDSGLLIGNEKGFLSEFAHLSEVQQKTRAVEALGELRAPEAVDTIVKFGLKANDPILRAVSAYSLGKIQDPRAVEPLQEAVRPYYNAAATLVPDDIIDIGTSKVSDETRRMKEKESRVRASVAWALGQIGDPSSRDTLLKAIDDQNSLVRDAAAEALAKIAEKEEKLAGGASKSR
jgi:HEAT repeat protein